MGRYYHMSKKVSDMEAKDIVNELKALDNVKTVDITEDHHYLKVETKDGQYEDVMWKAVNICRRIAQGCELQFKRFAYEDLDNKAK